MRWLLVRPLSTCLECPGQKGRGWKEPIRLSRPAGGRTAPKSARSESRGAKAAYLRIISPVCLARIRVFLTSMLHDAYHRAVVTLGVCPP